MDKASYTIDSLAFPISLTQTGKDRFTVQYGVQIDKGLRYDQAARKLGESIMHALACEGNLES